MVIKYSITDVVHRRSKIVLKRPFVVCTSHTKHVIDDKIIQLYFAKEYLV